MTSLFKDQYLREKSIEALICDSLCQALTKQLSSALCNAKDGGRQQGQWYLRSYVSTSLKLLYDSSIYKDSQKYKIIYFLRSIQNVKLSLDVQENTSRAKKNLGQMLVGALQKSIVSCTFSLNFTRNWFQTKIPREGPETNSRNYCWKFLFSHEVWKERERKNSPS